MKHVRKTFQIFLIFLLFIEGKFESTYSNVNIEVSQSSNKKTENEKQREQVQNMENMKIRRHVRSLTAPLLSEGQQGEEESSTNNNSSEKSEPFINQAGSNDLGVHHCDQPGLPECPKDQKLSTGAIVAFTVIPSVLLLIGVFLMWKYCCRNKQVDQIQNKTIQQAKSTHNLNSQSQKSTPNTQIHQRMEAI